MVGILRQVGRARALRPALDRLCRRRLFSGSPSVAAQLSRLFGPRVGWEGGPLDERELILKARAGSIAGPILAALCATGCFYGGLRRCSAPGCRRSALEWVYLGLIVSAYARLLPVLIASWLQPPPDEEE